MIVATWLAFSLAIVPSRYAHAADWDLWTKWPSLSGVSNPHVYGHWGPAVLTPNASWSDSTLGKFWGVHGALVYDADQDMGKVFVMKHEVLVYDLDVPPPGSYDTLDLDGNCNDPEYPPDNGHQPFCAGYVALSDGRLLVVGGPFWKACGSPDSNTGVPVTEGWASLYDPSQDLTYEDGGWVGTDDLPDSSGSTVPDPPPVDCDNNPLNRNRYYPTLTTLPDGRVLVAAGDFWNDCNEDGFNGVAEMASQRRWLIYDASASAGSRWEVESPIGSFDNPWGATMFSYPHLKMLPYGLFYAGNDVDANSEARPSHLWWPLEDWTDNDLDDDKGHNRLRATCVVLTMDAAADSIRVLLTGGGGNGVYGTGSDGSEIITYRNSSGTITSSGWSSISTGSRRRGGTGTRCFSRTARSWPSAVRVRRRPRTGAARSSIRPRTPGHSRTAWTGTAGTIPSRCCCRTAGSSRADTRTRGRRRGRTTSSTTRRISSTVQVRGRSGTRS